MGSEMCIRDSHLEPEPLLHLGAPKQVLPFLNELIGSHLDILIEQVASENLLSIPGIDEVGGKEEDAESSLGDKLHVLVVEEEVVVVQEDELKHETRWLTDIMDRYMRYFLYRGYST